MIWDHLSATDRAGTKAALAQMMGSAHTDTLLEHTLVREIEKDWFDHRAVPWHRRAQVSADQAKGLFDYNPGGIADGEVVGGQISRKDDKRVRVALQPESDVLLPSTRQFDVSSAGQLPTGFNPGELYPSRNHPRAVQMTVFAMSDALADLGMDWAALAGKVPADAVSVYISSAMGQLDGAASGGMLRARRPQVLALQIAEAGAQTLTSPGPTFLVWQVLALQIAEAGAIAPLVKLLTNLLSGEAGENSAGAQAEAAG